MYTALQHTGIVTAMTPFLLIDGGGKWSSRKIQYDDITARA